MGCSGADARGKLETLASDAQSQRSMEPGPGPFLRVICLDKVPAGRREGVQHCVCRPLRCVSSCPPTARKGREGAINLCTHSAALSLLEASAQRTPQDVLHPIDSVYPGLLGHSFVAAGRDQRRLHVNTTLSGCRCFHHGRTPAPQPRDSSLSKYTARL